jgi:anti-sigma factor RsiW
MTEQMDCAETRLSLGVYVLGAIDPAERAQVDAHLAGCRDCRDELAGLAGLPALLSRVGAEEAFALAEGDGPPAGDATAGGGVAVAEDAPPRELLATVIDLTSARRRRRRVRDASIGVAAALIIAAGVFGGLHLDSSPGPAAQASAQFPPGPANGPWETATGQAHGMTATVQYRAVGWGTQMAAKVTGIPLGTPCKLWVLGPGGSRTLSASWVVDNNEGKVYYPASVGDSAATVHGFVISVGRSSSIPVTV